MFFWDYETTGLRDIAGDARVFCSLVVSLSRCLVVLVVLWSCGLVARYPVVLSHSQVFSANCAPTQPFSVVLDSLSIVRAEDAATAVA